MRRLSAIMFADMVGYSALVQENEPRARQLRNRMRSVLEREVAGGTGELVQFYGDGALCVFPSAIEAVDRAVRVQRDLRTGDVQVDVRIGIHTGDVVHDEEGVFGDGVNVASRIEALAVPGSVLVSGKVHDELKNHPTLPTRFLGDFDLKNIQRPTAVYAVVAEGVEVPRAEALPAATTQGGNSVAVLPFVNMSSDPENEYFADGVTEEIINLLTRLNGLKVTARTSSFAFKGRDEDVRQIGRELGVNRVLEGSIRKSGPRVRITAQLIETSTGYHLFSDTYDRTLDDLFATQDEISATIVAALEGSLAPVPTKTSTDRSAPSPEGHRLFLQGRYFLNQSTPEGIHRAIADFEAAIRVDPEAGPPYAGIALCKAYLATIGYLPPEVAYPEAEAMAAAALEREPGLGEAHVTLGLARLLYHWDADGAFTEIQKGLTLNPGSVWAHSASAMYHGVVGDLDESLEDLEVATSLDPLVPKLHVDLAWGHSRVGNVDEAHACAARALELSPGFRPALEVHGWSYYSERRYEEALLQFQRVASQIDDPRKGITGLGAVLARMGRTDEARELLGRLQARARDEPTMVLDIDLAAIHLALGEVEESVAYIEAAAEKRLGALLLMRFHELWKPLWEHPRWKALWENLALT